VRVLIVKVSSMGDIVHAQPVVDDIRRHAPAAVVDWVCESAFAAIPALNPGVSTVIPYAWRRWRRRLHDAETRAAVRAFSDRLRSVHYDWVIDCQGLVKSAVVSRLARASRRAGLSWRSAREPLASLAYDVRAQVPWTMHVVERNRAVAAAAFGYAVAPPARFGLAAPADATPWLAAGERHAVLIPGASRPQKLWPEGHWVEVGRWLAGRGLRCVWLWGSTAERERVERIAAGVGTVRSVDATAVPRAGADAASLIPPFLSVRDAAGLLGAAAVVVGLDTGFTHLAGALDRPTVGIFCDFDATQCAVSGGAPCVSLGGVGLTPPVTQVLEALAALPIA
jgi:heptosyltransferase-1